MATRNPGGFLPTALGPIRLKANGVAVSSRATINLRGVVCTDDGSELTFATPDAQLTTDNSDAPQETTEFETTNATPTTVGTTFSIPTNTILVVDIQAVVQRAGGDRTKVFNIRRYLQNSNGTITAPAQENTMGPTEIGGALSCTVAIAYTGTTARVEFTGIAATNLRIRLDRQVTTLAAGDPAIVVSAITPNTGTAAGGTSVSITVDSSVGATGATVGGVALTSFAIADATHVTGTTGAHAAGAVDVTVTNAAGTGTLVGGFTYSAAEWDPTSLANFEADIDIRNATEGGGLITAITGATITGGEEPTYVATNADYDNLPTADIGNVSAMAIRLTPAQHGVTTGARTILMVCDATNAKYVGGAAGVQFLHTGGGGGDDFQISSDGFVTILTAASVPTTPQVVCFVLNGATSKIYAGSKTAIATGDAGTLADLTAADMVFGNNSTPAAGDGMGGSIARVLVYSAALSNTDVGTAMDGLAAIYGLTVTP